ncbi:glycosyltransferase [Seonamhaeicola sp. MEBiC1930]|uniref:glycosyltransferase n=1 Tax=Seonamhaeicola sp. MEBiC01930 TaxID=2976768 RepID=UPI0032478383
MQTVIPDYRSNLFNYIKAELKEFELFGGDEYFESSVKSNENTTSFKKVNNYYFFNRKFLFQIGFWNIVTKENVMVLELNPRIISNWVVLFVRKILKKKTVLWGHAWPRLGSRSKTDRVRGFMRNLADVILVYTATQKNELQIKMPNANILFAPNSVYYKKDMITNNNGNDINNLIYVGRLTPAKKAFFLVETFHSIIKKIPEDCQLIIIGDGEEKERIMDYINSKNLIQKIKVLGHIGEYEKLKAFYDKALFSVSPGYVGLSITQSFGFGVPMLISKDEPHSPELEAVIEHRNALFFNTDDSVFLGNTIINAFKEKEKWVNKRHDIMRFCQENYSIEAMAKSFISLIK